MSGQRTRPWLLVLAALAAGGLLGSGVLLVGEHFSEREVSVQLQATRKRWQQVLAQQPDPGSTYAAIAPGPSAAAWAELLAAAGVPSPALLPAPPMPGELPAAYRLIAIAGGERERADALARPGRAVIQLDAGGAGDRANAFVIAGVTVPLAGTAVHALSSDSADRAIAHSDAGAVLATVRVVGEGVVLRLGVDLGALLLRLRQGEPARAGVDHDRNGELQPADLQPAFDPALAARPFGDLATAALLTALGRAWPRCPLPRTRGLPAGVDRLVVLTGDQDYAPDEILALSAELLAAHDAHATYLLTDPGAGSPPDLNVRSDGSAPRTSPELIRELSRNGHRFGIHAFPRRSEDVTAVAQRFAALTGAAPLLSRNHHLRWHGYLDTALAAARGGVAMNLDFMAVCAGDQPCAAFPGGAAQPIRFVSGDATRLPLLQQPTAVDDYSLRIENPARRKLAAAALAKRARELLVAAAAAQVPLVVNAHPYLHALEPGWLEPLLGSARVISGEAWLDFSARRRLARIALPACRKPQVTLPDGVVLR